MAFREVSVVQVKEALRRWLKGDGERPIARGVGIDRKTARRYIAAAVELGVDRCGSEEQLSDKLIAQVLERVRPHRVDGHGEAWRTLLGEEDRITAWVTDGLTVVKIGVLLERAVAWWSRTGPWLASPQNVAGPGDARSPCASTTHPLGKGNGVAPLGDGHVVAHGGLADLGPVLVDQALPHPLGGVALFLGSVAIIGQPLVDDRFPRVQRRSRADRLLTWRRDGRGQRLAHRAAVRPEVLRQCADRQLFALMGLSDLLVELHLRPFRHGSKDPRRLLSAGGPRSGRPALGGAKSDRHSGAN
jgi:hypothetical protein